MSLALMPFERRWAHAAFDTIFPGKDRGVLPLGICDLDLDGFIDQTLNGVPLEAALGLRAAFWLVGLAPLFVLRRFATIASLSPEDRMRVVAKMNASPVYVVRAFIIMLKGLGALFYCGDRRVRARIVAVMPPVVQLRPRRASSLVLSHASHATQGAHDELHRRSA
jgi:hypothetical protein